MKIISYILTVVIEYFICLVFLDNLLIIDQLSKAKLSISSLLFIAISLSKGCLTLSFLL